MKPVLNNSDSFTLPRARILRGKHAFDAVFQQGRTIHSGLVSFRYLVLPDAPESRLIGFTARKKLGNAVVRNQLRRYLREAFRLQQSLFYPDTRVGFYGVFSAQSASLDFHSAFEAVQVIGKQFPVRLIPKPSR